MKRTLALLAALALVLLMTQLETYFEQWKITPLTDEKDHISYYFKDFSIQEFTPDGSVRQTLSGKHLSHWKQQEQNTVVAPTIVDSLNPERRIRITADTGITYQKTQKVHLHGNVQGLQTDRTGHMEMTLHTEFIDYDIQQRVVSTTANVKIATPDSTMQATGMTGTLDADLLRFNANVHSTYQIKKNNP